MAGPCQRQPFAGLRHPPARPIRCRTASPSSRTRTSLPGRHAGRALEPARAGSAPADRPGPDQPGDRPPAGRWPPARSRPTPPASTASWRWPTGPRRWPGPGSWACSPELPIPPDKPDRPGGVNPANKPRISPLADAGGLGRALKYSQKRIRGAARPEYYKINIKYGCTSILNSRK